MLLLSVKKGTRTMFLHEKRCLLKLTHFIFIVTSYLEPTNHHSEIPFTKLYETYGSCFPWFFNVCAYKFHNNNTVRMPFRQGASVATLSNSPVLTCAGVSGMSGLLCIQHWLSRSLKSTQGDIFILTLCKAPACL